MGVILSVFFTTPRHRPISEQEVEVEQDACG